MRLRLDGVFLNNSEFSNPPRRDTYHDGNKVDLGSVHYLSSEVVIRYTNPPVGLGHCFTC